MSEAFSGTRSLFDCQKLNVRSITKYGTFCIMGQQLNYWSELKNVIVGEKKIK